jgi:hypothetical protein
MKQKNQRRLMDEPATPARRWLVLPPAICLLLLVGCGYNQSGADDNRLEGGYTWNTLYREDIQSVAVPVFTTTDFRRGVEIRLTEALIKQLEANAPYKVVPAERADTILEGQVTSATVQTINREWYTNLPKTQALTLTVDFTWKDLRTGRILAQRQGYQQRVNYYPPLGEGEFIGTQEAIEKLALGIVQQLQADW